MRRPAPAHRHVGDGVDDWRARERDCRAHAVERADRAV